MNLSPRAKKIVSELNREGTKLGDVKKIGKEIKRDHDLAMELWGTGDYLPRLLSVLVMDKKLLTQELVDQLVAEIGGHDEDQRNQLADWLLANQLMKDKRTISLLESWENNPSPILRRLFWYHQARLRWMGKGSPDNSGALLDSLEKEMAGAEPEVQWTMNFCAGQIGIHEPENRARCIRLGEALGLYADERVAKNCTPSYLPEFIRIEVAKREGS
ncbi:MAG: DNA alkylation repair protein [Verrucomicrobiales bacterium]